MGLGGNSEQLLDDSADDEDGGPLFGIDIESGADTLQESSNQSNGTVRAQCLKTEGSSGVSVIADEAEEERGETAEAEEEWRAKIVETSFGVTDDIVNLRNGKMYYFFKLQHKVVYIALKSNFVYMYMCVHMCMCVYLEVFTGQS